VSDVTAAAERLAESAEAWLRESYDGLDPWDRDEQMAAHWRDQQAVARAYLAAHDPTPTDADWLRSVGFAEVDLSWHGRCPVTGTMPLPGYVIAEGNYDCCTIGVRWRTDGTVGAYRLSADGFDGSEDWLVDVPTRGTVRQLCRALGVPLREPT
jgi:hypothetical protein